jgi:hypothetical protein
MLSAFVAIVTGALVMKTVMYLPNVMTSLTRV